MDELKELIRLQTSKLETNKTLRYVIALRLFDESLNHTGTILNFIKTSFPMYKALMPIVRHGSLWPDLIFILVQNLIEKLSFCL